MKQLRLIEQETRVQLKARELPTLEEVAAKQQKSWMMQLEEALQSNVDFSLFEEMFQELNKTYSAEKITMAALHLVFSERFIKNSDQSYQFGDTGASPGKVRFFLNVGRNADLQPQQTAKMIAENTGIDLKQVGRINIYDRFSFVEVSEDVAPFVYEALRQSRINGLRINLEPARPRKAK
jgi:ATP-dependent RNA helicase DeaD